MKTRNGRRMEGWKGGGMEAWRSGCVKWLMVMAICGSALAVTGNLTAEAQRTQSQSETVADVNTVVNQDGHRMMRERRDALQQLHGRKLEEADAAAVRDYLLTPGPDDGWEFAFRDVVLTELEQQRGSSEMVVLLEQMHEDKAQHLVMRDFSLQHLPKAYVKGTPQDQQRIKALLQKALKETDNQHAGTALLALHRIATRSLREAGLTTAVAGSNLEPTAEEMAERIKVAETAFALAGDAKISPLTRATALQVCSRLGAKEALPLAVELAQNSSTIPLRIAAIAAVGDLGGKSQQALLQQLAGGPEPRLKLAAEAAMKRMQSNEGKAR